MPSIELLSAGPDELERRHDELNTLLEELAERSEPAPALAAARGLVDFWMRKGHLADGRRHLDRLLAAGEVPADLRAAGLAGAGTLAFRQGDDEAARRLFEQSETIAREAGDDATLAAALGGLARVALRAGDCGRTRELALQALELASDERAQLGPRHMLAASARCEENFAGAEELYGETLMLARRLDLRAAEAGELLNLGYMALHLGDAERATELFGQSLELGAQLGDDYLLPYCLLGAGSAAALRGDHAEAARLVAAAKAAFDATDAAIDPGSADEFDAAVGEARDALGKEFETAWAEGAALTLAEAVARARRGGSVAPP